MRWLVLLLLPLVAAVEVEVGWSGAVKSGAWAPVYVTAVGEGPATVELYVPGDGPWGQRIRRSVVLTPEQQTFPMFARIDGPVTDVSVRLFGTDGRTIAWAQPEVTREIVAPARLIGVGGIVPNDLAALDEPFGVTAVGAVRMIQLPREAIGYDGLDLLVLAEIDPADLPIATKNAIADWVQSGGRLAVTLATTPRLGDDRLDAMLREPGRYGLGNVNVGRTDWPTLIATWPNADVEAVAPPSAKSRLGLVIGLGLLLAGLTDVVLLRLCKRRPVHPVAVAMLVGSIPCLAIGLGDMPVNPEANASMVQADANVVRQAASMRTSEVADGWWTARAADGDAEIVQLVNGNRLRHGPAAVDTLDLTPADPVLLLVGDRLAAVGSVTVSINLIHHRGMRYAPAEPLSGGKVVDLTTLTELGPVETSGTLVEGEVDGKQLRAIWE
ncbi:MAG: hypothetical protein AAGD32_02000 [Planctomycetota bacterium]